MYWDFALWYQYFSKYWPILSDMEQYMAVSLIPILFKTLISLSLTHTHRKTREAKGKNPNTTEDNCIKRSFPKVYRDRINVPVTWQPRSPRPKILSPSVATITWIFLWGQFFSTSRILPLQNSLLCFSFNITKALQSVKRDILLFQTNKKTLRTPEDTPIFLACLTNSRSVDDWEQLLNIVDQKLVEQPFIHLL